MTIWGARIESIVLLCAPFGVSVLISVVIKITARLSAKTVTTGAKMTEIILGSLRCSHSLKSDGSLIVSLNVSSNTINGDAAMTSQRNPTLTINTTASASNGKKSITANPVLMSISPVTLPKLSFPLSDISAKLSKEE